MAPKTKKLKTSTKVAARNRNWTNEEVVLFAKIISDPNETFISTLEQKALKKSANNAVFQQIRNNFQYKLEQDELKTTS